MPDFKAKMLTALPQTPSWILWGPTSMGREGEEGKEGKGSPPIFSQVYRRLCVTELKISSNGAVIAWDGNPSRGVPYSLRKTYFSRGYNIGSIGVKICMMVGLTVPDAGFSILFVST